MKRRDWQFKNISGIWRGNNISVMRIGSVLDTSTKDHHLLPLGPSTNKYKKAWSKDGSVLDTLRSPPSINPNKYKKAKSKATLSTWGLSGSRSLKNEPVDRILDTPGSEHHPTFWEPNFQRQNSSAEPLSVLVHGPQLPCQCGHHHWGLQNFMIQIRCNHPGVCELYVCCTDSFEMYSNF